MVKGTNVMILTDETMALAVAEYFNKRLALQMNHIKVTDVSPHKDEDGELMYTQFRVTFKAKLP